jgi:TusA-related sulfurtransferase
MLDDLPDGQSLLLISDCPGTGDDLAAWAAQTGHEVIAMEKINGHRAAYTIRRRPTESQHRGNVVLDLRGASCPGPIVEARRLLRAMEPGEILVLISNCPGAPADVDAWAAEGAVRLIDRFERSPGEFEFYLGAAAAAGPLREDNDELSDQRQHARG